MTDDIRIPLHELQADISYLFGRVAADGSVASAMTLSVLTKLNQIEAAVKSIRRATIEDCAKVADFWAGRSHGIASEIASDIRALADKAQP